MRPDFKGLPQGQRLGRRRAWRSGRRKCASCHGIFGESNEVFSPLVGGTTADDVKTGRVARLIDRAYPGRTTLMKVSTVSTLWDYINRAMPWNAPKSLTPDEVYAVTAYLLNLGGVLPTDFTLSDTNIAEVQQRMPNRNGMTTDHGLWPGHGHGQRRQARREGRGLHEGLRRRAQAWRSFLPDFARNAHGNLAEQNRMVGAQHGADTTRAGRRAASAGRAAGADAGARPAPHRRRCWRSTTARPATAWTARSSGRASREVAQQVRRPRRPRRPTWPARSWPAAAGVWGAIPMPAQTLSADEVSDRSRAWLAAGAEVVAPQPCSGPELAGYARFRRPWVDGSLS